LSVRRAEETQRVANERELTNPAVCRITVTLTEFPAGNSVNVTVIRHRGEFFSRPEIVVVFVHNF